MTHIVTLSSSDKFRELKLYQGSRVDLKMMNHFSCFYVANEQIQFLKHVPTTASHADRRGCMDTPIQSDNLQMTDRSADRLSCMSDKSDLAAGWTGTMVLTTVQLPHILRPTGLLLLGFGLRPVYVITSYVNTNKVTIHSAYETTIFLHLSIQKGQNI